jgi:hypothetical protein
MLRAIILKRLAIGLLVTFLISAGVTLPIMWGLFGEEAEYAEGGKAILIMVMYTGALNLILTLSSLPVFLNVHDKVRHHRLYRILAFFLLPFLAVSAFIVIAHDRLVALTFSLPFVLVYVLFYFGFSRTNFERLVAARSHRLARSK